MQQDQFLDVIDRDEAEHRFHAALDLRPLGAEDVPLGEALHRVLARDVVAPLDVPSFDRANVDGFAVHAEDTFGATEDQPRSLRLNAETLPTGVLPRQTVTAGTATAIATGAVMPRGADAVVMVEYTDAAGDTLLVRRPVAPGANVTFAGTDIGRGETVLRRGDLLTSRETGVLAALGLAAAAVVRRPRVAVVSTGDEIIPAGAAMRPGLVYDSNATVLADAVRELGGEPVPLGIVPDDRDALRAVLRRALAQCDLVLLSGGTSKGTGDLSYRVVGDLGPPGILAHGVALKPGKPLCLAAVRDGDRTVPVVILPGFPTSAIFTFREFVAPVLRRLAARRDDPALVVPARLPMRVNSERGRTEYLLVGLVGGTAASTPYSEAIREAVGSPGGASGGSPGRVREPGERGSPGGASGGSPGRVFEPGVQGAAGADDSPGGAAEAGPAPGPAAPPGLRPDATSPHSPGSKTRPGLPPGAPPGLTTVLPESLSVLRTPYSDLVAYPMGKGSGSVTAFSRADGFVVIPRQREYLEAGDVVEVHLLGRGVQAADLVVIGSHCVGLDYLLGRLQDRGLRTKFLAVGSTGGLTAARRGECDLAGIHLLDPETNTYNRPYLTGDLRLLPGYGRLQGIVFRPGDVRFEGRTAAEAVAAALADPDCVLVSRNRGSGTRVLIDRLLGGAKPPGYLTEARSHNAVAAAVAQGRADWGVAIRTVAADAGLGFLPLQEEQYDFVIPAGRWDRPAVRAFRELLGQEETRQVLERFGFRPV